MRSAAPLALLIAVLLLAAGCGNDDAGERPQSTPLPTGTPTGTQTPAPTPTATPTATPTRPAAEVLDCGLVAYAPQSDYGAFEIEARGTTCETAKAVATAAKDQSEPFDAEGFSCEGEPDDSGPLPSTEWTCRGPDGAEITFATS